MQVNFDYIQNFTARIFSRFQPDFFLFRGECDSLYSPSSIYYNDFPHSICIDFLKKVIQTKAIESGLIQLIDSDQNTNGLFSVNGMKKPLYYLFEVLADMGKTIVEIGSKYIATRGDKRYDILAYNERFPSFPSAKYLFGGSDSSVLSVISKEEKLFLPVAFL